MSKIKENQIKVLKEVARDVHWDGGWRQYIFDDGGMGLKMAEGCLYEVFEKIRELRLERANG